MAPVVRSDLGVRRSPPSQAALARPVPPDTKKGGGDHDAMCEQRERDGSAAGHWDIANRVASGGSRPASDDESALVVRGEDNPFAISDRCPVRVQ